MAEIASAYVTLLPSAKGMGSKIEAQVAPEVKKSGSRIGSLLGKSLKASVVGVGASAGALLGTALVKGFGRLKAIDQAQMQLRGLKLEGKQIDSVMKSASKSVTGTAYGLDAAAGAAAGALGAGVKRGKELTRYLKLVADATTQSTTDFRSMALMLNKVQGSGKLTGDVLQQMQENGLQVMPMLTKAYGKNAAEIQKMVSKGEISSKRFREILKKNIGGAAKESGSTFTGALANVGASLGRIGAGLLGGVFPHLAPMFQGITTALKPLEKRAADLGDVIGRWLGPALEGIGPVLTKIVTKLTSLDLSKLKMPDGGSSLGKLGSSLKKLGGALADVDFGKLGGALVKGATDTVSVFSVVIGFAADHVDTLAKILPALVVAFAAYKTAQAASNVVSLAQLPITAAQIAGNVALARSNFQLVAQMKLATAATVEGTAAARANATATALQAGGLSRVGLAARGAAGLGGMAALTAGATTSNKALGTLANIGGGAMMGFAVGGPIGAAIGGGAGALLSLATNTRKSGDEFRNAKPPAVDYKSTLEGIAAAASSATRELALKALTESGAVKDAQALGISTRDLVSATIGNEKAQKRINGVLKANASAAQPYVDAFGRVQVQQTETGAAVDRLRGQLGKQSGAFAADRAEVIKSNAATAKFRDLVKGLPENVVTRLRSTGFKESMGQVRNLAREYKLTPKQIRILARAEGFDLSKKQAEKLAARLKDVGDVKPNMKPFTQGVKTGTDKAKGAAETGSRAVGTSLKTGMLAGTAGLGDLLAGRMNAYVKQALAAARAAADAHSPSRETYRLGRDMGDGLALGIEGSDARLTKATKKVGKKLMKALKDAIRDKRGGLADLRSAFSDMVSGIASSFVPDLFSGSLGQLGKGLATGTAGVKAALAAIPKLTAAGLNLSGGFLQGLFASGNTQLIAALAANPALAKQYESQFNALDTYSKSIGQTVAAASAEGAANLAEQKKTNAKLDTLIAATNGNPKALSTHLVKDLNKTAGTAKKKKGPKRK